MRQRFDRRATVQALTYLASHARRKTLTKLEALKLLYLADRDQLRKWSRTISGDGYLAMKYGPVAANTKSLIEHLEKDRRDGDGFLRAFRLPNRLLAIRPIRAPDMTRLSESEVASLDCALRQWKLHPRLVPFTHRFPEWKIHQEALVSGVRCAPMDLLDFFLPCENPADEYCDATDEMVSISREIYREDQEWFL